ncbi:MAG: type II toxin-antitoxin system VapC family toxin [Chloroflexi bacterium]|nr:type II toxin-antitoxin system VapC family toxin [Chloroflexota bacterium]
MRNRVFLDTAYAIALSASNDSLHEKAKQLALEVKSQQVRLVTTRAVMLEVGNALGKQRYRATAIALLRLMEKDPTIEIVPLSEDLFVRAYNLYSQRPDKEWGLIDCVSFIVMEDNDLIEALTSDDHFQQAGFQALMRS